VVVRIVKIGAPGVSHLCRSGFVGRASAADYALASDLLNSDYAAHWLTVCAVRSIIAVQPSECGLQRLRLYRPAEFVKKAAGLSDRLDAKAG
jgi:membrane-anchored protein YejM (alkaline phosphatase superfamily)